MTKTQKLIAILSAFVLAIGLSACVDGTDYDQKATLEFTATLSDGTQVPCIKVEGVYGIACDFAKAKKP